LSLQVKEKDELIEAKDVKLSNLIATVDSLDEHIKVRDDQIIDLSGPSD